MSEEINKKEDPDQTVLSNDEQLTLSVQQISVKNFTGYQSVYYRLPLGEKHGEELCYDVQGRLIYQIFWHNGLKDNEEKAWHSNGTLSQLSKWVKGVRNGIDRGWFDNGKNFWYRRWIVNYIRDELFWHYNGTVCYKKVWDILFNPWEIIRRPHLPPSLHYLKEKEKNKEELNPDDVELLRNMLKDPDNEKDRISKDRFTKEVEIRLKDEENWDEYGNSMRSFHVEEYNDVSETGLDKKGKPCFIRLVH